MIPRLTWLLTSLDGSVVGNFELDLPDSPQFACVLGPLAD